MLWATLGCPLPLPAAGAQWGLSLSELWTPSPWLCSLVSPSPLFVLSALPDIVFLVWVVRAHRRMVELWSQHVQRAVRLVCRRWVRFRQNWKAAEYACKWKIKDLRNSLRLNSLKALKFHLSCKKGISFYRTTVFFCGIHPSRPANVSLDRWNFKAMYCISWDGCMYILCLLIMVPHNILY